MEGVGAYVATIHDKNANSFKLHCKPWSFPFVFDPIPLYIFSFYIYDQ